MLTRWCRHKDDVAMALGVLDIEFPIGIDKPDSTWCDTIVVDIAGHLGCSRSNNVQTEGELTRIDDLLISRASLLEGPTPMFAYHVSMQHSPFAS